MKCLLFLHRDHLKFNKLYRIVRNKANDRGKSQDSPTAGQQPPELSSEAFSPGSAQQKYYIQQPAYGSGVTVVTPLPPTEHLIARGDGETATPKRKMQNAGI